VTAHTAPPSADQPARPSGGAAPRHAADQSIGDLVHDISASVSTLVQREVELAKLELRSSVKNLGTGAGMFAAAGVLLVFSLTFGFIALAEGLIAAGLDRQWLGFLVVFGFLLLVIAGLVFLGIRKVKRVKAPQQTISTSKETVAYLKDHPRTS
jgi:uncharacterized membrane protein YqjE